MLYIKKSVLQSIERRGSYDQNNFKKGKMAKSGILNGFSLITPTFSNILQKRIFAYSSGI